MKINVIIVIIFALTGCNTFFEEDISDQHIKLLSPVDEIDTDIATQNFWWEKVNGATGYRFQITSPSFDSTQIILEDTLTESNSFGMALYPGDFQWRVRAENSGYISDWSSAKLHIHSTADLTKQQITLLSPGTISGSKLLKFQWERLYNAKSYMLVIYKDQWEGVISVQPFQVDTTFSFQTLIEGRYVWGVKAKNLISETAYTKKNLTVDITSPAKPVLIAPADSSLISGLTVAFMWNSSDATSGIAHDSIKVYTDRTLRNLVKSFTTDNGQAELTFADRKDYYWTVRSVDKAGNVSVKSDIWRFTLK